MITPTSYLLDDRNEEATKESPYAIDAQVEGETYTPQSIWHLIVENFLETNHCEDIRKPKEKILRSQPPYTHRKLLLSGYRLTQNLEQFEAFFSQLLLPIPWR